MAVHPEVRKAIRRELGGVSRQAIHQRVSRLQRELPMSPEDGEYVLAHRLGVPIQKYLDRETLASVASYVAQLGAATSTAAPPASRKQPPRKVVVKIAGVNIDSVPAMTGTHAREAKLMAAKAYPILYVFENSARDVISQVLEAAVGSDWWDTVIPANSKLRRTVEIRKSDESKEPWHSRRGAHPIHYLDLPDLSTIVRLPDAWPHFKPLFGRTTWFESVIDDMNVSRRVVAHMNPLSTDDVRSIENGFRKWVKQLKAKKDFLP